MTQRIPGRNPVLEALRRQRRAVHRIHLDTGARVDPKIREILDIAQARRIPVGRTSRKELDRLARGDVHNGVVAEADPLPAYSVAALLDELAVVPDPCVVMVDEPSYEHNLGAILRSALGAGVSGVVVPTRRGAGMSSVVARVAMGGAEAVPLVREGISSGLKRFRKAGYRVVGADMDGRPFWEVDLTGPLVLVLGGESKGLTPTVRSRCDEIIAVPLAGELESLNVSVTAGILLFERVRQRANSL
ncbi:MAG: 23S rRNA (guanosine(2251)-2'-O)-methyltransferase RlmB [Alphaproteobacteria bacterium]|nr:23S rRNA (guanosine(2251)-2'-O)-methyltransferase RlmB [Alphaproteobacteria bacterium]